MTKANSIEIIQAENGYFIRILARNPASLTQRLHTLRDLQDSLAQTEVPEMQELAKLLESIMQLDESMFTQEERVLMARDGAEVLDMLAKIIAVWEPEQKA